MADYFRSTRHPWACLLFLLPLLAAYEGGLLWLGGNQAETLRNGADSSLRSHLETFGARQVLASPAVVLVVLMALSWRRWADRPRDPVSACFGMAFESCLYACLLWQFSRNFGLIVDRLGIKLQLSSHAAAAPIITSIGAGIYEEVLFRVVLFIGGCLILRAIRLPTAIAVTLSAAGAALAFAAAHHIGPYGEPLQPYVFLFRTIAGLYFTIIFVGRGFGIAVGTHAGYDVLIGVGA